MSRPHLSHSSFSRLSINDEEDDDDAWAADSDDESKQSRFTQRPSQQQPRLTRPMLATGGTGSRSVSTSSIQTNSSSSSSVSSSRRHAPPARPHPFPIPPSSASSQQRSASSSSSPALSGWTMVDARTGKPSTTASSTSLAGSPPTDVGSTAAEAVIKAASEAQHTARASSSARSQTQPPETGVSLSRPKSRESSAFVRAIRPDLPGVVNDPFAALDALAAEADMPAAMTAHDKASTSSDTAALSPVTPRPRTSSSTAPSSRRASRVPREAAHFDPITMGGDGLIMGGGTFGSSSSSLEQVEDEEDEQDVSRQGGEEEADMTVTSDSISLSTEAPAGASRLSPAQHPPLRRAKSVRTKRRYREFLRCLNPPSPTGASSSSNVDLRKLRELSWNGIPSELRPIVWPLLLGYVPANSSMRSAALARKRADYRRAVTLAFGFDPFADGQLDGAQGGDQGEKGTACEEEGKKMPASAAANEAKTATPARPSTPQSRSSAAAVEESGRRTPLSVHASRRSGPEEKIWHQIAIDVPRTNPGLPLWQRKGTQRALERLLYVWAIRHHATGYVQGMSDLATPFFEVFLSNYLRPPPDGSLNLGEGDHLDSGGAASGMDHQSFDPSHLPLPARLALEADTFWCLSSLLDGIQENYIFAQPGIVRQVRRMEELVARIDAPLHAHLKEQGVEYIQFAFRWMNCLLMREMSVRNVVRLWDTYLAEGADAFSDFHLYVCSVFLCKWSARLREMDFQGCIMFLQSLPTQSWSDKDAELLLSEAFVFKNLFAQTKHLND